MHHFGDGRCAGRGNACSTRTEIGGSKFLEIPDCGHCPQIEKPDAFVKAIDEFFTLNRGIPKNS
jgi:pimeloyl-ACP methyl ester carboxylesterase